MKEEPCQCSDCQRFYREHDRLIREFPTLKQQQELNWASIQSFRTLCGQVTEELKKRSVYSNDKVYKSKEDVNICSNLTQCYSEAWFSFRRLLHIYPMRPKKQSSNM